jgi:beta-lactamase regulating signal transducer with metallopeptidase domain
MSSGALWVLSNLGAGALLGWFALALFARITSVRPAHDVLSIHRALLSALVLAGLLMFVPFARALIPQDRAMGVAIQTHAGTVLAPAAGSSTFALGYHVLCLVGATWSAAAALACALALVSVAQLAALIRRARRAPLVVERMVSLCTAPGARKIRRSLVSDEASVPFVAIPWSPVLVIPAKFYETFDHQALALMIEHEAAHVARGDLWINAFVRAVCVVFPFHPAAARLAKEIAFAREAAVDASVSRRDPHRYAKLLVDVAAKARFDQLPRPVSMDDTALARRIDLLTDSSTRQALSVTPLVIIAAIMGIGSLLAPPVFAAARDALPEQSPQRRGPTTFRHTPESSYAACEGKGEGDACPFPTPDGDLIGSCTLNADNGRWFCAPPPPPDTSMPSRGGDPAHRSSP